MHTHTQTPVHRGLVSVFANASPGDVPAAVVALNDAFTAFKASHKGDVDELKRAVDDLSTKNAAQQMNGAGGNQLSPDAMGVTGFKAMRTAKDFQAHYRAQADDVRDQVSITDFVRGVAGMKTTDAAVKALSRGTNTTGGYTVPAVTMPTILAAMAPVSSLLQAGAGVVPMEEGAKSVTTAAVDTLPTAAWRLEGGEVAMSEPAFRGVVATPQSLAFYFKITRELLADAPNIEAALRIAIGQAFAKEMDRAGLRGSGTAPEPRGLSNTAGVQVVTNGANGAALANYNPVLQGMQAILDVDGPMPTAIIAAPRTVIKLGGLVDTTGQPIRKPELVEPLPIIATSQIPVNLAAGTSSDASEIYMGNFANMYFMLRENVSIQLLREKFSSTGEIGFMCHVRVDVVVTYPQAFVVIKGVRA